MAEQEEQMQRFGQEVIPEAAKLTPHGGWKTDL
jgi:hypothetical protein